MDHFSSSSQMHRLNRTNEASFKRPNSTNQPEKHKKVQILSERVIQPVSKQIQTVQKNNDTVFLSRFLNLRFSNNLLLN